MASLKVTQAGALALIAAGTPGWTNLKGDVATTIPASPGRQAVIGDFGVPAYAGYAQATVVLTGGWVDGPNGKGYAVTGAIAFPGPSSGPGADMVALVLSDGTSHTVWAYIPLDSPLPLQAPTDRVELLFQLFEDLTSNVVVLS